MTMPFMAVVALGAGPWFLNYWRTRQGQVCDARKKKTHATHGYMHAPYIPGTYRHASLLTARGGGGGCSGGLRGVVVATVASRCD